MERDWLPVPVPIAARVAACITCVALIGVGSTSVGSPTFVASDTSGCFSKVFMTFENWLGSRRLSSSALFCATAALVALAPVGAGPEAVPWRRRLDPLPDSESGFGRKLAQHPS